MYSKMVSLKLFFIFLWAPLAFLQLFNNVYAEQKCIDEAKFIINKIYSDDNLKEIAFPLGGFGAGQIYIRGDGKLSPWEIVNNFNSNATVSDAFFSIFIDNGTEKISKILQKNPLLPADGVNNIKFIGEFPFALLKFEDFAPSLDISLECFSPFIPLDELNSSLPAIFFTFTLKNNSTNNIKGVLAGTIPNIVGWDGYSELKSSEQTLNGETIQAIFHPELGYNINTTKEDSDKVLIDMGINSCEQKSFPKTIRFITNQYDSAHPLRYTSGIKLQFQDDINQDIQLDYDTTNIYWLGPSNKVLSSQVVRKINEDVQKGAHLILNGDSNSVFDWMLAINNARKGHKKDLVIDNFESRNYKNWTITGDAFGEVPADGKFPLQTDITGHEGKYFINSYNGDDKKTGKAVSKTFTIRHHFLHFRIGGGNKPETLYLDLIVDGVKVLSATGSNSENLRKVIWNISNYVGKEAQIEIVDNDTDGWGHILIDDIVLSNKYPIDKKTYKTLLSWLPFTSQKGEWVDYQTENSSENNLVNLNGISLKQKRYFKFHSPIDRKNLQILLKANNGTPLIVQQKIGKGSIIWCNGDVIQWFTPTDRKDGLASLLSIPSGITYTPQKGLDSSHPLWGNMAFAIQKTNNKAIITCSQWNNFNYFWQSFSNNGVIPNPECNGASNSGYTWNGTIAYPFELDGGEKEQVTFLVAWYFPNRTRGNQYFWTLPPLRYDHRLGNFYNNHFHSAREVIEYCLDKQSYLVNQTAQFHKDLFTSSLPSIMLEAISANIATLHSPIYIFLEDGTVGGFEGTDSCCPMNCTHVYNYAQTLPYLFPKLEQQIRYQELVYQMDKEEHYIPHRFIVPPTEPQLKNEIGGPFHHALDGELGTILKLYREYKISGDRKWIEPLWTNAVHVFKHILEKHDPTGEGIIRGEQPNTYDTHLYGSNTFIGSLYLAVLKSMENMLRELGGPEQNELIQECQKRFNTGVEKYIETCWNGEYFINVFDAPDVGPEVYNQMNCYGPGCHSDQLLGQWWAHILGLGYLFPEMQVKTTLNSIYKYNWRQNFYGHTQLPRRFAEDDEPGLLMCSWPNGGRPDSPILYCDEIWTGMEYEIASFMIYEGDFEKATEIVTGARSRYSGNRKNPWSEIECGGHYARAMSAYALLLASSGFLVDNNTLIIHPRVKTNPCTFFYTTGTSWGVLEMNKMTRKTSLKLTLHYGKQEIKKIGIPAEKPQYKSISVNINKNKQYNSVREFVGVINKNNYGADEISIIFREPLVIDSPDESLFIEIKW